MVMTFHEELMANDEQLVQWIKHYEVRGMTDRLTSRIDEVEGSASKNSDGLER